MILPLVFPTGISYGASGGPGYNVIVTTSENGREQRVLLSDVGLLKWDVAHGVKDQTEYEELLTFFREVRGKAFGFLFFDWADHTISMQSIGTGDGVTKRFKLIKTYGTVNPEIRRIRHPKPGTVSIMVGLAPSALGADFTVAEGGYVDFTVAPAVGADVLVPTAEFYVPCRFDIDQMQATLENFDVYSWGSITVSEIAEEDED